MSFAITAILEKLQARDKDFQYMGVSDLLAEVEKETFKFDPSMEGRVVVALLNLLKTSSNNIQELAVKCMGPLVKKVKEPVVIDILENLSEALLNEKSSEELRDICSMGLKAVINVVPADSAALSTYLHKKLTPRLLVFLQQSDVTEVKVYCLDIIVDLLNRMGRQVNHEAVQQAVLPLLTSNIAPVRKRCITCVGLLAGADPDPLFAQLLDSLLAGIASAAKADHIRTLIQCISAIGSAVGFRVSRYLSSIVPILVKYCDNPKFDQDDELRENCFQAFEILSLRCPKEMSQYVRLIMGLAVKFIKYDPNYTVDDEETEDVEVDEVEEEEETEDTDYSDDDDLSWKVRRSSAKCLAAIITTRIDLIQDLYQQAAPILIARFREREENVKLDIFRTFVDLLRQTAISNKRSSAAFASATTALLSGQLPKTVTGVSKQLHNKSIKVRLGAFCLLQDLVSVLSDCMGPYMPELMKGILYSLKDRNSTSNLKVEALVFLRLLFQHHQASIFYPHIENLTPLIVPLMTDTYYRIAVEALRVASTLCTAMRPTLVSVGSTPDFNYRPYVPGFYAAALTQLKAQDIDQEVKEWALNCMGTIISVLGDDLVAEIPICLHLLLDKLRNEITRLTTIKVISKIAESPLHVDLNPILTEVFGELAVFLRKSNRQLRQSSLMAMSTLFVHYSASRSALQISPQILAELCALITDNDLFLSHLALQLCSQIIHIQSNAGVIPILQERVLPQIFELLKSSLLQGVALQSLLSLFTQIVSLNTKTITFDGLIDNLLALVLKSTKEIPVSKQSFSSVSQCIASICVSGKPPQRDAVVVKMIKEFSKPKDESKLISLLTLGEIGRRCDLSHQQEAVMPLLLSAFEYSAEEIKQAASFALGNVAVGSMERLLPFVLAEIGKQPHRQYLLLHSIREIIIRQSSQEGLQILKPHLPALLKLLCAHCESDEEGTRNVVAECLGKLTLLIPGEVVPKLDQKLEGPPFARSTVVATFKYAVTDQPQPVDTFLMERMPRVLNLLDDPEPVVRRSVLLTLNYIAHHKPDLIRETLPEFLPKLYNETRIKPELIKEVDLGPFKHKVDSGLEIRKNAYECMYTFLDTTVHRLDIPKFVVHVAQAMSDHYDIKMLAHLMIIRLTSTAGAALLEGLDILVEPLRETIQSKPNETDVKQEIDRHEELVRSALRAIYAIARLPNSDSVPKFREFMRTVVMSPQFAQRYREVAREDSLGGNNTFADFPMSDS
ncbi:cullin-associated NEDD8-dissociated protein 1 [Pelomyxa schiedti]|nr:cullin-associated NEDD8-dissociated protein 1 [Pelomyxa schiedti]